MIRTLLLSTALTVVAAGAAFAADLPSTKEAPVYAPPPPPAFSWSGIYIGVNGGYGGDSVNYVTPAAGTDNTAFSSGRGFLAGGTVGFNYEIPTSNFVIGFEGDFDWTNMDGAQFSEGRVKRTTYVVYNEGTGADWLATARARLGYSIATPFGTPLLLYGTGGAAFGAIRDYGFSSFADPNGTYTHTWTGWSAGAGFEYAITQNLTVKTEYLHIDLGTHSIDDEFGLPGGSGNTEHFTANIVRAGLNWKFDWFAPAPAPVVAKY
jgi:outer membrane immunogenic protein